MILLVNFLAVTIPLIGFVATMVMLWGNGFDGIQLAIFVTFYVLTGWGVTIGYHRLFTHKSFETNKYVTALLGIFGSMALEGPILRWVAAHRRHHQHSDSEEDPHSPHLHGEGWAGMWKGIWHAHVGWLFHPDAPGLSRYVGDLRRDPLIRRIDSMFLFWVFAGLALPALLGGLLTMSWYGALLGFLWGGLARIFLVHHVTWSINSVCHLWGSRPFPGEDESRNNFFFGVMAMGEGWHNNHHAFPTSARHGLWWWQLDISYLMILLMKKLGLAWNVKVPDNAAIAAKRAHRVARQEKEAATNPVSQVILPTIDPTV